MRCDSDKVEEDDHREDGAKQDGHEDRRREWAMHKGRRGAAWPDE
jgi:hypothetical protein